jgi:hypothetical protein
VLAVSEPDDDLNDERRQRYEGSDGWMIVHRYRPSDMPDQTYDISISMYRHPSNVRRSKSLVAVRYAVGDKWAGSPFIVEDSTSNFELRLSAYGSFLCIAELRFDDGSSAILDRYIDFEMSDMLEG